MDQETTQPQIKPKWKPIGRIGRRVLGVLVEKAKTTPDAYPLTLNALTNGCNQKSNRDPQMNLESYQVETALEELRRLSAAIEVSGSGRVAKFRHMIYEWMGIEKLEAAVMAELLLRGAQTTGELRGRAARMDPIADLNALQPILASLMEKGLVLSLTPAGRGQVVTHSLYRPEELEKIRQQFGSAGGSAAPAAPATPVAPAAPAAPVDATSASPPAETSGEAQQIQELRVEVKRLQAEVERLKTDVQDLWSNFNS
ncbi:MAG: hypothetical protein CMJ80_09870 [Planctomycetaceae bacterium]|nr:hypothetical protein [Planctomycetaceae bacterium]